MTDIVDKDTRSMMMSKVPQKNTKLEVVLRHELHRLGFRYRLNVRGLPGSPDLVFPKYKAVVFVNGCFWHGHDCHLFSMPRSNVEYWSAKIKGNIERDMRKRKELELAGWRSLTVWGCTLKRLRSGSDNQVALVVGDWLVFGSCNSETRLRKDGSAWVSDQVDSIV